MRSAWLGGVVCLVGIIVAVATQDPLPPEVSFVFLVPLVIAGIGLVLQSTAGRGLGTLGSMVDEASWLHVPLVLLGWGLIGLGASGLLLLPSANTVQVARLTRALPAFCNGDAPERVERDLLPTLRALSTRLPGVDGPVREAAYTALGTTLPRCVDQLTTAFARPQGTHASWGQLRDWLVLNPDYTTLPPDLSDRPLRRLQHAPRRPPVRLDL